MKKLKNRKIWGPVQYAYPIMPFIKIYIGSSDSRQKVNVSLIFRWHSLCQIVCTLFPNDGKIGTYSFWVINTYDWAV